LDRKELENGMPGYFNRPEGSGSNIHILPWSRGRFAALAARSTTVGLWKVSRARALDKLSVLLGRRFAVIDSRAKGTWEYVRYAGLMYDHMGAAEKTALRARSKDLLAKLSVDLQGLRQAYVFGTGPSLARAT